MMAMIVAGALVVVLLIGARRLAWRLALLVELAAHRGRGTQRWE